MMQNNVLFWLLICGHLIGDFYAQPQELAKNKKEKLHFLLLHGCIYAVSVGVLLVPVMSHKVLWAFVGVAGSHLIIDFVKLKVINSTKTFAFLKKNAFYLDQAIHIAIMITIAYIYANMNIIALNSCGSLLLKVYHDLQIQFTPNLFLRFVFVFILIGKPANILIAEINSKGNIKNAENKNKKAAKSTEENCSEYQNVGKIIGILERILIIIMVVLKQYTAIGFVFAAKSITRYDKITKDASFAEYYLVGTLLSVAISIAAILVIQPI